MFTDYLKQTGLEKLVDALEITNLNDFVEKAFEKNLPKLSKEDTHNLYIYDVPKLSPDGSCSILEEKSEIPYDLSKIFGESIKTTSLLWRLKQVVKDIYKQTDVDWFGIYKKVKNQQGVSVLAKLSYLGLFSRAEFPLTDEFAKCSNNSTVGLTGIAKIIQDVSANKGPYYKCDGNVQSEFCLPILNKEKEIIGIIDAEAFSKNFFTAEKLLQIAKIGSDLGKFL